MKKPRAQIVALVVAVAAVLVLAGCGSSSKTTGSSSSDNTFILSEFTIVAPTKPLHAGSLSITANNVGGERHELVIVRAATAAGLPMKPDGSVDEGKIASADKIGDIPQVAPRSHLTQPFDLPAGTYVAFCNLVDSMGSNTTMGGSSTTMMGSDTTMGGMAAGAGHVHFAKGMHVEFTVAP